MKNGSSIFPNASCQASPSDARQDRLHIFGTCSGTEPMKGRHHCAFAVEHGKQYYWFDAGESCAYTAHLMGVNLQKIRSVFISHPHMDHVGGLGNLLWTIRKLDTMYHGREGMPLSLYLPDERIWDSLMLLLPATEGDFQCDFEIDHQLVDDGFTYRAEGISVTAMHNQHLPPRADGTYRSFSYRIRLNEKTIVFTGDVKDLREIEPLLQGAQVLLAETGHHHPSALCAALNAMGLAPHLMLIHHGRAILEGGEAAVEEARAIYPQRITLLEDGDSFAIRDL